jgi:hypothetical protein
MHLKLVDPSGVWLFIINVGNELLWFLNIFVFSFSCKNYKKIVINVDE